MAKATNTKVTASKKATPSKTNNLNPKATVMKKGGSMGKGKCKTGEPTMTLAQRRSNAALKSWATRRKNQRAAARNAKKA